MGAVFLWAVLYGLTEIGAEQLSRIIPGSFPLTPSAMLLYTLMLILWLCRTGRAQTVGLQIPRWSPRQWLNLIPLLLLPGFNLLTAGRIAPDPSAVALMLSAAVTEEVFFRGFLLHFLAKRSKSAGIFLSSILFAAFHLVNLTQGTDPTYTWMQVLCAFAVGLCYSTTAISIGSLLPCIAVHFLTNITGSSQSSQSGSETAGLWICILVCICWGIMHSYKIRKNEKENQA